MKGFYIRLKYIQNFCTTEQSRADIINTWKLQQYLITYNHSEQKNTKKTHPWHYLVVGVTGITVWPSFRVKRNLTLAFESSLAQSSAVVCGDFVALFFGEPTGMEGFAADPIAGTGITLIGDSCFAGGWCRGDASALRLVP